MAGMTREYECPVCHEDYTEPKILPCAHLACRNCVISWLGTGGGQGGCPKCRASILPTTSPGQGDLAALVDALPTDLATVALVESQKILNGPHVCTMCHTNVIATSYCLQCDVKLCQACTSYHQKLPASKDHAVEDLSKLTALKLAASRRSTCKSHTASPVELHCSSHQELICTMCATTNHRSCPEVKAITDVAKERRTELKQQAQRLRQKDRALAQHITSVKDKFKVIRREVKDVFDDLQECVEKRRQQVNDLVQTEEVTALTSLTDLERVRTVMTSHAGTIDHIVTSSPDDGLLLMLEQLTLRFNNLEVQSRKTDTIKAVGNISFDDQILIRLKSDLSTLGKIILPTRVLTPTATSIQRKIRTKPRGAALARVLKVGDRVRKKPDYSFSFRGDNDGQGTVTAVPSQIAAEMGSRKRGLVDVLWDTGRQSCHSMGYDNDYELDLV